MTAIMLASKYWMCWEATFAATFEYFCILLLLISIHLFGAPPPKKRQWCRDEEVRKYLDLKEIKIHPATWRRWIYLAAATFDTLSLLLRQAERARSKSQRNIWTSLITSDFSRAYVTWIYSRRVGKSKWNIWTPMITEISSTLLTSQDWWWPTYFAKT